MSTSTRCEVRVQRSVKAALLAAISLTVLGSCAHEPAAPFVKDTLVEQTATVETVLLPSRMVQLRREDGTRTSVIVGPEVRNLDQVEVGDRVRVAYYQGLAAELKKPGEGVKGVEESTTGVAARPGERPAAGAGSTVRTTVKIESVDKSFNTVTFKNSDGMVRTLAVESPEGQKFIRELRPGQDVEVTYTEAVAVDVRPAG